jgi:hypothetical protein
MRSGRPKTELVLSETEREKLESMARRARSAPQLARRARTILKCAERVDNKDGGPPAQSHAADGGQVARAFRQRAAGGTA